MENKFKVGDILVGVIGYSMILPVWFKVVKVTPKQVVCNKFFGKIVSGNYMEGAEVIDLCNPCRQEKEIRMAVREGYGGQSVCYYKRNHLLTKWDGTPVDFDRWD